MKKIVPVYPWPMHPKIAEQLAAIDGINPVEALPGGPGPVLAIRKHPPFVCDALVVSTPDAVEAAVRVVINDGIEMVSVRDQLSGIFGAPMTEVIEPGKVRFQ